MALFGREAFFGGRAFSAGGSGETLLAWKAPEPYYFASGKPGEAAPRKSASLAFHPRNVFVTNFLQKKAPEETETRPQPCPQCFFARLVYGLARLGGKGFACNYNGLT